MIFENFFAALSFLTRIPPPPSIFKGKEVKFSESFAFFPLVGILLGFISVGLLKILRLFLPSDLSGFLATMFNIWLTRALHLDGLADWVDGMGGGYTPSRRLEIMKDSRIGSFGAVALFMVVALKSLSLGYLQEKSAWSGVVFASAFSRYYMVVLAWKAPAVSSQKGLGSLFIQGFSKTYIVAASLWLLPLMFLGVFFFVFSLALTIPVLFMLRRSYLKSFEKITGDLFGATSEIMETILLLWSVAFFNLKG